MASIGFIRLTDFDLNEPLTIEAVAAAAGTRPSLIERLVRIGILDVIQGGDKESLLSARTILQLRRMQRLRRDLRVNFIGAAIILDLVDQIEELKREISAINRRSDID
jgi:hypothetical protein